MANENWFCTECPDGKECEVIGVGLMELHEARSCPDDVKAVWYTNYECMRLDGKIFHMKGKQCMKSIEERAKEAMRAVIQDSK